MIRDEHCQLTSDGPGLPWPWLHPLNAKSESQQQQLTVQIMDELVKALMGRYPQAVLQFEDFNMAHAAPLLERYRDHHLCFNDDIQVPPCFQPS